MAAPQASSSDTLRIERADQLKALGHPLRLRVLQLLGESDRPLTNRELAELIGVDPGHLHFHVRMLHKAGLIDLAEGGKGREKPYRPVAPHLSVSPEFRAAGLASELDAAMLDEVARGWAEFGSTGAFRAGQLSVRLNVDVLRQLVNEMLQRAAQLEDDDEDPLTVTVVIHPRTSGADA